MQDTDLHVADRLAAWLRLERSAGIGPRAAAALLDVFGNPDAVFAADFAALAAHVSPAQAHALLQPPGDATRRLLDATLDWLATPGHHVLALGEPGYPELLARIPDPPLLLYIRGHAHLLDGPALAIVGIATVIVVHLRRLRTQRTMRPAATRRLRRPRHANRARWRTRPAQAESSPSRGVAALEAAVLQSFEPSARLT